MIHYKTYVIIVLPLSGSSSGIGAQAAKDFNSKEAKVVLVGRNLENLNQVASECQHPENTIVIQADVTDDSSAEIIINKTLEKFGKIDVLVNNAGVLEVGSIETTSVEQYDRVMNTNMRSI